MKRFLLLFLITNLGCNAATKSFRNLSEKPIILEIEYDQGISLEEAGHAMLVQPPGPVNTPPNIMPAYSVKRADELIAVPQITQTWRIKIMPGATAYAPSGTWSLRKIKANIEPTTAGQYTPVSEFLDNEPGNAGYTLGLPIQQSRVEIKKL